MSQVKIVTLPSARQHNATLRLMKLLHKLDIKSATKHYVFGYNMYIAPTWDIKDLSKWVRIQNVTP